MPPFPNCVTPCMRYIYIYIYHNRSPWKCTKIVFFLHASCPSVVFYDFEVLAFEASGGAQQFPDLLEITSLASLGIVGRPFFFWLFIFLEVGRLGIEKIWHPNRVFPMFFTCSHQKWWFTLGFLTFLIWTYWFSRWFCGLLSKNLGKTNISNFEWQKT